MKRASVSEAKNNLSRLLDQVRHGQTIIITDRKQPVAKLVPIEHGAKLPEADEARLAELERAGLLIRGSGKPVASILAGRIAKPRKGGDILKTLLADREEGR